MYNKAVTAGGRYFVIMSIFLIVKFFALSRLGGVMGPVRRTIKPERPLRGARGESSAGLIAPNAVRTSALSPDTFPSGKELSTSSQVSIQHWPGHLPI